MTHPDQSHSPATIAFDLGNVLIRVDHLRFCQRLADHARATPAEVFQYVFAGPLEPAYDTGKISSEDFHRAICEHFSLTLPFDLFAHFWRDIFAPLEGMAEVVARLLPRYPLFLVSNTNALHFDYIRDMCPYLDRFRRLILSYEVGSRKPEPGIYQTLIRATGGPAGACLFIDDKEPFVAAARHHGLQAWQFTSVAELEARLTELGVWEER